MSFTLGSVPQEMTVRLNRDADFVATLRTVDGSDWPTAAIELRFPHGDTETVWAATVVDDEARWNVDKAGVNALKDAKAYKVLLFYIDGDTELLWASGSIK